MHKHDCVIHEGQYECDKLENTPKNECATVVTGVCDPCFKKVNVVPEEALS